MIFLIIEGKIMVFLPLFLEFLFPKHQVLPKSPEKAELLATCRANRVAEEHRGKWTEKPLWSVRQTEILSKR